MPHNATTNDANVLIVGASVRGAAFSALAAGFSPTALDLFADEDLANCCAARRVARYPGGLVTVARKLPESPWFYTGGLENHPRVVDAIARQRPLWGNTGDVLRRVRDPWHVAETLRAASIEVPRMRPASDPPPTDDAWLLKDYRSSGGLGVRPWNESTSLSKAPRGRWYFQQRIHGRNLAAVFLTASGSARLLGVTEQFVGTLWCGARPFAYAGSLGPLRLSARVARQIECLGAALAKEYSLRGLLGVDLVRDRQGRCWPLDINPRYPASAEVLELAAGVSFVGYHAIACRTGELPAAQRAQPRRYAGKAIVYAPCELIVSAAQNRRWHAANESHPLPTLARNKNRMPTYRVADIPAAGANIPMGAPVVTLIECGADLANLRDMLRRRATALRRRLQRAADQEPSSLRTA